MVYEFKSLEAVISSIIYDYNCTTWEDERSSWGLARYIIEKLEGKDYVIITKKED